VHREDDGEEPSHADRNQRPDEKEMSAVIAEAAGDPDSNKEQVIDFLKSLGEPYLQVLSRWKPRRSD
jgi:hypothetical protein